jgi:aconitase A
VNGKYSYHSIHSSNFFKFSILKLKLASRKNFWSCNYTYQEEWCLLLIKKCVRKAELTKICLKEDTIHHKFTWISKLHHVWSKNSSKYLKWEAAFSIKSVGETESHIFVNLYSLFKIKFQYILGGVGEMAKLNY